MLLFAYIMPVLATAPALEVARVTLCLFPFESRMRVAPRPPGWVLDQEPAELGSILPWLLASALAWGALGKNQQSLSVVSFIYLIFICLCACCWAATQSLPSNLWHPQHLLKGLFPYPRAFLTPCRHPWPQLPFPHPRGTSGLPVPPDSSVAPAICLLVSPFPFWPQVCPDDLRSGCHWALPLLICNCHQAVGQMLTFFTISCLEKGISGLFFCYWNSQMLSLFVSTCFPTSQICLCMSKQRWSACMK